MSFVVEPTPPHTHPQAFKKLISRGEQAYLNSLSQELWKLRMKMHMVQNLLSFPFDNHPRHLLLINGSFSEQQLPLKQMESTRVSLLKLQLSFERHLELYMAHSNQLTRLLLVSQCLS